MRVCKIHEVSHCFGSLCPVKLDHDRSLCCLQRSVQGGAYHWSDRVLETTAGSRNRHGISTVALCGHCQGGNARSSNDCRAYSCIQSSRGGGNQLNTSAEVVHCSHVNF